MSRLLYLLIAVILALIAQRWLDDGTGIPRDSLILFLIAGGLFAAISAPPPAWPALPPRRKWRYHGIALSGVAAILAAVATVFQFWQGQYGGWGLWLWLAAIPLFAIGAWLEVSEAGSQKSEVGVGAQGLPSNEVKGLRPGQRSRPSKFRLPISDFRSLTALLLLGILVAAAAVRFYALDMYPNGCQSDECNNGLDALKWLSGNFPYTPYAETNEGQATLFTYLIALFIKLFGQSVTSMRMVSALAGTLTVLAFYFLAREVYGQRIALLTAALVAVDRWHLTFSRIVYELILMPLVLCLQVLFLIKALKTGRRRWWALAGLMLALGMNTYTAYRVVPAFLAVYLVYWLITHRQRVLRDLEGMAVFAAGAVVAVAPLGTYIIQNWRVFTSRINHISVFRDVDAVGSYEPLWSNLRKTLYMFNWQGDAAALNNLPGAPLLSFLVAAALVLGVLWALRWAWRELPFLYLVWFVAVASVAVLSVAHEAPTARRPIGLVPVIYLLVAAVVDQIWRAWEGAWGAGRWRTLAVVLAGLALVAGAGNINTYFRVQAVHPAVWGAYSPNESAVGRYLATLPDSARIYMTPQYTHHSAVRFIGGSRLITPLNLALHVPLREDPGGDVEFILEPVDERLVPLFQQLYAGGAYRVHRDRFGRTLFLSYRVPRQALDAARGLKASYSPAGDQPGPPVPGGQAHGIDFDFAATAVMPAPFIAHYEGALLAPRYGEYTFELSATGGEAVLYLDEAEALRVSEGSALLQRTLAGGFQGLKVVYNAQSLGTLRLRWTTPQQAEMSVVDQAWLYSLPGASNGLVGYYYANGDWRDPPSLIQRDLFILPNNILREPFSIRWLGKVAAPTSGRYIFGTRSDDGSFVFINGQLVVDNGGVHGAEYREGVIELQEGFHEIEVLYNELGGSREMQLWWQPPGGAKTIIPSAYLYPLEEELPQGLELPPLPTTAPQPVEVEVEVEAETGERVADPGRVQDVGRPGQPLGEFPTAEPAVLWTYGSCGEGAGQLRWPMGVAVDGQGNAYVADAGGHRIVQISADGEFIRAWGEAGEGPGQFTEVFDVAVTPGGEIAALDAVNQVISLWTSEGRFLRQFGAELTTYRPRGIAVAANGDFFIADTGGVRVLHVGADGQRLEQFGGPDQALGPGQPTDVAAGANVLYVVEPLAGSLWRIDLVTGQQQRFAGPQAGTIEAPHLALGRDGRIFITDPEGGRVLVFSAAMQPLAQFGGRGTEPGRFNRPVGVAVAADGTVLVVDPDHCRLTAFSPLP